jgi:hypothetical protein
MEMRAASEAAFHKDHREDQPPNDDRHRRDGDKLMLAREATKTGSARGILMRVRTASALFPYH